MKLLEKIIAGIIVLSPITEGCNKDTKTEQRVQTPSIVEIPTPSFCVGEVHLQVAGKYVDYPVLYCKDKAEKEFVCTAVQLPEGYSFTTCYTLKK